MNFNRYVSLRFSKWDATISDTPIIKTPVELDVDGMRVCLFGYKLSDYSTVFMTINKKTDRETKEAEWSTTMLVANFGWEGQTETLDIPNIPSLSLLAEEFLFGLTNLRESEDGPWDWWKLLRGSRKYQRTLENTLGSLDSARKWLQEDITDARQQITQTIVAVERLRRFNLRQKKEQLSPFVQEAIVFLKNNLQTRLTAKFCRQDSGLARTYTLRRHNPLAAPTAEGAGPEAVPHPAAPPATTRLPRVVDPGH